MVTDTRCGTVNCKWYDRYNGDCAFKEIVITEGKCKYFEEIKEDGT